MRILHTSDWHLGASLGGFSRLDEQRAVLGEICRLARDKHVDLVLLAGDVYDSFTPPAAAEQLFLDAMDILAREKIACVVIAGNPDSPDRLCAPRAFAGTHGIYIVGLPGEIPQGEGILESAPNFLRIRPRGCGYDCAIAALPYPSMGRLGCEEDEYSARVGDMFRAADEHFKPEYVNLAVSHLSARGGKACGIERPRGRGRRTVRGGRRPEQGAVRGAGPSAPRPANRQRTLFRQYYAAGLLAKAAR